MTDTPKDRDEAIEMIARIVIEYPHRVREVIEAAEKLGLRLVSASALSPFLTMAKACEGLHDREPIAVRAVSDGNNQAIILDARRFHVLAQGVMSDRETSS